MGQGFVIIGQHIADLAAFHGQQAAGVAGIGNAELVACFAAVEDGPDLLVLQLVVVAVVINGQEGSAQTVTAEVNEHQVVLAGFGEGLLHGEKDFFTGSIFIDEDSDLVIGEGAAFGTFKEGVHAVGVVVGVLQGGHVVVARYSDDDRPDLHGGGIAHGVVIYQGINRGNGLFGLRLGFAEVGAGLPIAGHFSAVREEQGAFSVEIAIGPMPHIAFAVGVIDDAVAVGHAVSELTHVFCDAVFENIGSPAVGAVAHDAADPAGFYSGIAHVLALHPIAGDVGGIGKIKGALAVA